MALTEPHWFRPQQLRLDGVRYDISVCRCGNGLFQSSWLCSDCCEKAYWPPRARRRTRCDYLPKSAFAYTISCITQRPHGQSHDESP